MFFIWAMTAFVENTGILDIFFVYAFKKVRCNPLSLMLLGETNFFLERCGECCYHYLMQGKMQKRKVTKAVDAFNDDDTMERKKREADQNDYMRSQLGDGKAVTDVGIVSQYTVGEKVDDDDEQDDDDEDDSEHKVIAVESVQEDINEVVSPKPIVKCKVGKCNHNLAFEDVKSWIVHHNEMHQGNKLSKVIYTVPVLICILNLQCFMFVIIVGKNG